MKPFPRSPLDCALVALIPLLMFAMVAVTLVLVPSASVQRAHALTACAPEARTPTGCHFSPRCARPRFAPWRSRYSDGCLLVRPNASATLPRGVSEVDVYSLPSADGYRVHLYQERDRDPYYYHSRDGNRCPQYAFTMTPVRNYSAGWVTCNRDVFNYGTRSLVFYYWRG